MILLLLISSLPVLINGDCGCQEVWKEIANERKEDEKNFGCRSCSKPVVSAEAACPVSGFECKEEWQITSNVLTAGDNNRCSEAKCAGKARLASDRNIINKMCCNDGKWTVDDIEAEPVVCAKPCNSKVCAVKYTKALPEFEPLKIHEAGEADACAVGFCEKGYTPTVINENGIAGEALAEGVQMKCTGDGLWKADEKHHKYVMCKENPSKTCKDCDIGLITVNTMDPDTIAMTPMIDDSGSCKKATFTCGPGTNTVITLNGAKEFYDSDDNDNGDRDGTTHFEVVCNGKGDTWMYARDTTLTVMTLKCTNI